MASPSQQLSFLAPILLAGLTCTRSQEQNPDIPPAAAFEQTLRHDLETYFAKAESVPINVTYELLRKQATITGIAYPKFYVWVEVRSGQHLLRVGAARLAAISGSFEVTNFLPADAINRDSTIAGTIFPSALVSEIAGRARNAPHVAKRGA